MRHGDARPFRVVTAGGVVEDIGTAFEVARDNGTAVRVQAKGGGRPLVLHRRQRAHYGPDGGPRCLRDQDEEAIAAWRRGYIVVEEEALADAVKTVARYRSAPVWAQPGAAGRTPVNGTFLTDAPDDALKVLADMAGLRLIRLPGGAGVLAK